MSPESERYVLAVDLGSGSAKVALVSRRGTVVAAATEATHTTLLPAGGAEQDPAEWWEAVTSAARQVTAAARVPREHIVGVACASQWAVTVPVDQDGQALGNAISWMDSRGGRWVRRLVGGRLQLGGYDVFKLRTWIRLTGGCPVLSGADGLGHVLFLRHERPDLYRSAHKLLEPMDYLNARLTGRCAASMGTIFPYWLTDNRDPLRIDYHPDLLRLAGVDRAKMPDLVPVGAVLGSVTRTAAEQLDIAAGTPVVNGLCDGHAATVGAGAVRNGEGYASIGTTSWLSCHMPAKKTDLLHLLLTMPAALPGRYMVVAEQGSAGRCLEVLKDQLFFAADGPPPDAYAQLDRLAAEAPPGCDGLLFTPWLDGTVVPAADPYTRSAFVNQSGRTTRAHYVRAVMEGIAFNLRWLKPHVERFAGHRFPHLRLIGGAALSPVWCQILADALDCPVLQVANPRQSVAVGAALTAFTALGMLRVEELDDLVAVAAEYRPDPSRRDVYARQFREFVALFRRLKPIYRRLNGRATS